MEGTLLIVNVLLQCFRCVTKDWYAFSPAVTGLFKIVESSSLNTLVHHKVLVQTTTRSVNDDVQR
jgi:hypothetical protein